VSPKKSLRFLLPIILLTLLVSSCGVGASGTYVWIDVPVDGLSFPDVQPVNVEGHATGREGIARVELFVDGELWITIDDPPTVDTLANFQAEWLPPGPGSYIIHAVAYGSDGEPSEYDETRISFGINTPTPTSTVKPVISITPTITDTPPPPPQPEASVSFWADPETIDAGNCTDIRWQAGKYQCCRYLRGHHSSAGAKPKCSWKWFIPYLQILPGCFLGSCQRREWDQSVSGSSPAPQW